MYVDMKQVYLYYSLHDSHWSFISQLLLLWPGYLALSSQTLKGPTGETQGIRELGWEKLHL